MDEDEPNDVKLWNSDDFVVGVEADLAFAVSLLLSTFGCLEPGWSAVALPDAAGDDIAQPMSWPIYDCGMRS